MGSWGQAQVPFEGQGQVALIGKPALSCHTNQGQVSRFEQALGSLNHGASSLAMPREMEKQKPWTKVSFLLLTVHDLMLFTKVYHILA